MSETVRLKASDGHELDAYVSSPSDEPIAGLVVIQFLHYGIDEPDFWLCDYVACRHKEIRR